MQLCNQFSDIVVPLLVSSFVQIAREFDDPPVQENNIMTSI